jgi:lipase chaperone LimK
MKLTKKSSFLIFAVVIAAAIAAFFIYKSAFHHVPSGHVMKNSAKISIKDAISFESIDFNDPKNIRDFIAEGKVNGTTLNFLDFIMNKFQVAGNFDEHFEQVKDYLYSILPADEAEKMLSLYKKYIEYQRGLQNDVMKWPNPTDTASAIRYLDKLQDYRRQMLGDDVADALFGADVKVKEYQVRKNSIVSDNSMYGAQKEAELKKLDMDMWTDDASQVNLLQKPYDSYRDKMAMYQKDFSEMNSDAQQEKIDEFRQEFFTPDVIARLKDVDATVQTSKATDEAYRAAESTIQNDPSLTPDEKKEKIREAQDQIYGNNAEAFRQLEALKNTSAK